MLTRKFWKHLINEGFLKTYTRGYRATRNPHYQAGHRVDTYVACKGQDEFGNKYYECFNVDSKLFAGGAILTLFLAALSAWCA